MEGSNVYQPLNHHNDEIRLLEILQDFDGETVRCNLVVTSLINPAAYVALSYTWVDPLGVGAPPAYEDVVLNGELFAAGRNLVDALRYLRSQGTRWIWADALSINQSDLEERGQQVLRMGQVYEKAKQVVVWLGPATNDSDTALQFIETLAGQKRVSEDTAAQWLNDTLYRTHTNEWKAIANLLKRRWWTRAWVVQETVRAKEVNFVCGQHAISGAQVEDGMGLIAPYFGFISESLQIYEQFSLPDGPSDAINGTRVISQDIRHGVKRGILYCLLHTRGTTATDDRDCIYGKLGLPSEESSNSQIFPNYRKSAKEVFTDFTTLHMQTTQKLDVMCQPFDRPIEKSLPSWVPNWKAQDGMQPLQPSMAGAKLADYDFHASGSLSAVMHFPDNDTLVVRGFIVDRIESIGYTSEDRGQPAQLEHQSNDLSAIYPGQRGVFDALWRSLVADQNRTDGTKACDNFGVKFAALCIEKDKELDSDPFPLAEILETSLGITNTGVKDWYIRSRNLRLGGKSLRQWVHDAFSSMTTHEEAILQENSNHAFERSFHSVNRKRRLVTTDHGYIGVAPAGAQLKDLVCVLKGLGTPAILRQKGADYELIGECYIHSLMHGEAIDMLDRKEFQLQDFTIR
ncbi:MAG: hypothetical protein M1822_007465 [Bathelium mastoideum]|nr:MAG: hypothetical protein M1822_007465 [Bathelium mastoideum]